MRYNEEKEQQAQWNAKIKELDRIEEARKNAEKKSGEFSLIFLMDCFVLLRNISFIAMYLLWPPCNFCLLLFFNSSPNLNGRKLDVYHTSTHGVALLRI